MSDRSEHSISNEPFLHNDGDIDLLVPGFADKAANPIQTDIWLFENELMDGATAR